MNFWLVIRRNPAGDIDESLIPQDILDWYGTDDEEETVEEVFSDVETV